MYGIWYPRICANVSHCGTGVVGRNGVAEGGEEKTSAEQRWRRRLQRRLLPPPPFLLYLLCSRRGGARRKDDEGEEERHFSQSPCAFNCYFNENSPTARHCPRVPPRARSSGPDIAAIFFFLSLSFSLLFFLSFFLSFAKRMHARYNFYALVCRCRVLFTKCK